MSKDFLSYLDPFRQWDTGRLLAYLRDPESPPARLTYAAEVAGRERSPGAQEALLALTHHTAAVVREGAIMGLGGYTDEAVVARMREMASGDPSPGVRGVAECLLADLE
jgi:HEAT repeat protein